VCENRHLVGRLQHRVPGLEDVFDVAAHTEPLAVQAEHCYPVPPLALPERKAGPEAVADVDAVALFCERARAHDPTRTRRARA